MLNWIRIPIHSSLFFLLNFYMSQFHKLITILVGIFTFSISISLSAQTATTISNLGNGITLEQNTDFSSIKYKDNILKQYQNDVPDWLMFAIESSIIGSICSSLQGTFEKATVFDYEQKWQWLSGDARRSCGKKLIHSSLFTRALNSRFVIVYSITWGNRWLDLIDKKNFWYFTPGNVDDILLYKKINWYHLFVTSNITDSYDIDNIYGISPSGVPFLVFNNLQKTQSGVISLKISSIVSANWNAIKVTYLSRSLNNTAEQKHVDILPLIVQ